AGCQYCMAHTGEGALHFGVDEKKLAAVWEFRTSPLFSEGERVALDFAIAAASVPNGVTDDLFAELRKHWSEAQIVEIVGVIATFGFLNRWNDTMGTPLEAEPMAAGARKGAGAASRAAPARRPTDAHGGPHRQPACLRGPRRLRLARRLGLFPGSSLDCRRPCRGGPGVR